MKLLFSPLFMRFAFIGLPLLVVVSCKKDDPAPPTAPAVTTAPLTNVTSSSATTGGTILTNGNAAITQNGIVLSQTNATPTLTDSVIAGTTASGSFTINLTGLDFNRTYYIRAFATNSVGTGYGDVVTLNTANDTTKVRFMYNGKEVVYGIIISPVTGKKWLDRNLGAEQVATSYDDYKAYGDLFQWGRPADGHQLINWTASDAGTAVNGTTEAVANSDIPGHSNFIIPPYVSPWVLDWRSDNNRNRWATIPQGPCPAGWHVPTRDEWLAEVATTMGGTATSGGMTDRNTAYSQLKLTIAGKRGVDGPGSVNFGQVGTYGHYWSSTDRLASGYTSARDFEVGIDGVQQFIDVKASAKCVRCLVN
ncbi:FISUMP domain-containing protein [Niastella populi]|uniref:Fibronectin type-III domain-containing protein n=1 Tax=Niastella populi TaxID=550983 RepID=A0A1V9GB68_9BACT|nr:FISUMP domain-containing protein [Niastella populi]OQP67820.1 hypothetical protein A4R26_32725 [Niastella populi]